MQKLTELFQNMLSEAGYVPQEQKDAPPWSTSTRGKATASPATTTKVSLSCDMSIAGKILAHVLLNRFLEQGLLPQSQCGFRAGCGTADMIFAACELQEKCQAQNRDLSVTSIDLMKAFDMVSREGLFITIFREGKFITIVQQLHAGMMVKVLDDGDKSEAFPVINGVKQCCVLVPTIFSMVFSAMLTDAFRDCQDGLRIWYRGLFNLRRLKAVTKVKETTIKELLFADDRALIGSREEEDARGN